MVTTFSQRYEDIFYSYEDSGYKIRGMGAMSKYHSERAVILYLKDNMHNFIEDFMAKSGGKSISHIIIQIKTAHWEGPCRHCQNFCVAVAEGKIPSHPPIRETGSTQTLTEEDQLSTEDYEDIWNIYSFGRGWLPFSRRLISNSAQKNSKILPGGAQPIVYCNWLLGTRAEFEIMEHDFSSRLRRSSSIVSLQLDTQGEEETAKPRERKKMKRRYKKKKESPPISEDEESE